MIAVIAEHRENSSNEESESSDCYNVSSSELSTSPKSSGEEESISNQVKVKGDVSTTKNSQPGRRQKKDTSLNAKDMEDIKTWIFTVAEVKKVKEQLWLILIGGCTN